MSPQTIEVEIDASVQVQAVHPQVAIPAEPALLTLLAARRPAAQPPGPQLEDWHAFVGALAGCSPA
ncbi:MAG TPA: hypothetical protein PKC97_17965 [Burkholderiaceae bacterium]|nr:hypothetical protein [Burkholderiaceae bacterium]